MYCNVLGLFCGHALIHDLPVTNGLQLEQLIRAFPECSRATIQSREISLDLGLWGLSHVLGLHDMAR